MKLFSEKQNIAISGEHGMALLTALIIMVMLTSLGLAGIYLATTDIKISRNYKIIKQKFFIAEAALEQGINILRSTSIDDWSGLIAKATLSNPLIELEDPDHENRKLSDIEFCGMYYTIRIKNNLNDPIFLDQNLPADLWYSTDTDDILVIISECRTDEGHPKYLETAVRWEPNPVHSYGGKDITTDNINVIEANIDWS